MGTTRKRLKAARGQPPAVADAEMPAENSAARVDALVSTLQQGLTDLRDELSRQLTEQNERIAAGFEAAQSERMRDNETLTNRMERLERQQRCNNLVLKGFGSEATSREAILQECRQLILAEVPAFDVTGLERAVPMGQPSQQQQRSIMLRFVSVSARGSALRACKGVRARRIYLDTDLTADQQNKRRQQKAQWDELKLMGKKPYWRDEMLMYIEDGVRKKAASRNSAEPMSV